MLLLDLSSIIIPEIIIMTGGKEKEKLTEDLVRRVVLSQILTYKNKYNEYGSVVICSDSRHYWRKDLFKQYKENRKKLRKESHLNWTEFYILFNRIKEELKTIRGFKLIEIEKLEADDIIAILSKRYAQFEKVMIVSTDKDLLQLQMNTTNIEQFSPKLKKKITIDNKKYFLIEHIIRGDSGDGIPNILSDDDVFLDASKRQKSITTAFINEAKTMGEDKLLDTINESVSAKYIRNKKLIDLTCIPREYAKQIVEAYEEANKPSRNKVSLFDYAIKYKLRKIISQLGAIK